MARPPDSSTPPSHRLPYPPGESKLELVPTEVLEEIFCDLSPNGLLSFQDLKDQHLLEENRNALTNMRSLCLTSKRVDAVTRSLLFRTITISSPEMLIRLYGTLLKTPDLGCHIRQISFEILLQDVGPRHFLAARSSQGKTLLKGCDSATKADGPFINQYCCDKILSACFFEILRRTPNVHQLVLRIQPTNGPRTRPMNGLIDKEWKYMYQPFFRRVKHAIQASRAGEGSGFLPRLTTLHLLGDPYDPWNVFDIAICHPLLQIHTLKEVKTFRDNGIWSALQLDSSDPAHPGRTFKNVRRAELQQSACLSRDFRALGTFFTHLEVLKVSIGGPLRSVRWPPGPGGGTRMDKEFRLGDGNEYFREALTKMKDLHTLTLDLNYDAFSWGPGMPVPMNPTLASLPKLETVKIPLQMLIEDHRQRDTEPNQNRLHRLVEVLPRSLRSLTITVEVYCDHCAWDILSQGGIRPPSSTIVDFMEALSRLGHEAFPGLKEVICCYSRTGLISSPDYGEREIESTDFGEDDLFEADAGSYGRLELLRTSLQQQQIQFKVAYDNIQCPHGDGEGYFDLLL